MAIISSNTLFHFTPTAEYLISILTNEFHPRYSLEKIQMHEKKFEYAIPMVCFCDIPLSQIKNHVKTYGSYGLGMTKEWATKNKLNPVLYLKDTSFLSESLYSIYKTLAKKELEDIDHLDEAKKAYVKLFRYIKPYQGDFEHNSKIINDVRFYNEREWRYTAEWSDNFDALLSKNEFNNSVSRAQANKTLEKEPLKFEPNDIAYIIVKEENEIFPMIHALKQIKEKYDSKTIEILNSRIITCDQILNDF